jgi:predicted dithiol-disulfide oxidoreductase (DUF899 family)
MTPQIAALQARIDELKKELSAARRAVAPVPVGDYAFRRPDGSPASLSDLFAGKRDLLVVHNMGKQCVYCTLWADGLVGFTRPLLSRCGFVLTSPDEPATLKAFAESRGWTFPCVSVQGTTFAHDMGMEPEPGRHWPGVSGFRRRDDGSIVRTGQAMFGPGDDFCALWPMLDLLEGGAGAWVPKYDYPSHNPDVESPTIGRSSPAKC